MVSMTPGGAQRSTAALVARLIAAPASSVPARPMNWSVPLALQVWPGVSPWTTGAAGAVAQADSREGAIRRYLRIHGLLDEDPAHLELTVLDGEAEPALDQVERVLAEL